MVPAGRRTPAPRPGHLSAMPLSPARPHSPPARPPLGRFAAVWGALALLGAVALLLVSWGNRLPAPVSAAAPATSFAAERAWPVLAQLADSIGLRVTGTEGNRRALGYLERRLRAVPRLEVEVQDTAEVREGRWGVRGHRVRNLVARLPGRRREAVLVSAHYDSPPESVGAADDGVAVAVIVELARALAAGAPLEHSVIFNVNDGEELGLLGATAFTGHRWMRDVRAFVNLESAGPGGRPILFQTGPGNGWLTRAYARAAPFPHGSVYGQDLFQSGAIPSATDFEVYRDRGGARGLDIALYRDGYAYHTALDRTNRVAPGSVQHMGSNALALVRELAAGPLPGDVGGPPSVYYDVLGRHMVVYDASWAPAVAGVALLLALVAAGVARRAFSLSVTELLLAAATALIAIVLAFGAALGGAALASVVLARPHGWYAHPGRGYVAHGALALAAMLAAHALLHRRFARRGRAEAALPAAWAGALLVLTLLLAALTAVGVGSAYVLSWWGVGGAAGLLVLSLSGGRQVALAAAVGLLPPLVVTLQTVESMLALFVPIAGRFPVTFPFDLVIAALVALGATLAASLPLALAHHAGRLGLAAAVAGAVGLAALALTAATFPYTAERPQRIALVHEAVGDSGYLRVRGMEFVSPRRAVADVPGMRQLPARGDLPEGLGREVGGTGFAPPAVEVLESRDTGDGREVALRLRGGDAYTTRLRVPAERLVEWSLTPALGATRPDAPYHEARFVAAPDSGWRVVLRLRGREPVLVRVAASRAAVTPAARQVMNLLPPWASAFAVAVDWRALEI